ncbi:MAG: hypothetical protein KC496_10895 [Anaerolineae bacterium]|nr:hypothetical protein [Anaerolineae bacterium]
MGLQEQIAEAIVLAFDELGGDPRTAVESAMHHPSVESWVQQETAKIAVAGGAEMIIPGLHALTIPAGISYLMHKMAHISWGIGALKGVYVVETSQFSDLRNILTLWANASYFNAHIIDHLAISMDAFEYSLTEEGAESLRAMLQKHPDQQNIVMETLRVLETLAHDFGGDERAQRLVAAISGQRYAEELILSASVRTPEPINLFEKPMSRRISTRLALRLAARISARVPARMVMGFIPLAGAVVNAFFNAQTLNQMADTAIKYCENPLLRESLEKTVTES